MPYGIFSSANLGCLGLCLTISQLVCMLVDRGQLSETIFFSVVRLLVPYGIFSSANLGCLGLCLMISQLICMLVDCGQLSECY